jgi:pimeloyl-ACP methyl ester carboxylesterase
MRRVRGFIDLVFDVVEETTNLVERTHDSVVERTKRRFAPIEPAKTTAEIVTGVQTVISAITFESIRTVNGITRFAVNAAADTAETNLPSEVQDAELATPIRSTAAGTASWVVDYAQASLNGFWGDYIERKNSRLDLGMTLRHHGRHLPATAEAFEQAFPNPTPKVCVFVHALAATEWLWSLSSEAHYGDPEVTFGTRLLEDAGFTPIYLRYNSGLHISENGKRLATLLDEVLDAYPISVEEIALVGHSMGGLVARSAAHYGSTHDARWAKLLRHVACIGSPHLGAPLEKAVHVFASVLRRVDAAGAQVTAELLAARSVGVKDLRYGYTLDEEWSGEDPDAVFADARKNVPLVDGVGYYFVAATISRDPDHPVGQLLGDLLVRLPSAAGEAPEPARRVRFNGGGFVNGVSHVDIASHPAVYDVLRDLLAT